MLKIILIVNLVVQPFPSIVLVLAKQGSLSRSIACNMQREQYIF